jgi:flavorubredoxin
MRDWVKRMTDAGAIMIAEEGLMCNEAPDDDGIEKCKELGEKLADN